MKKTVISAVLTVAVLFAFSSCGNRFDTPEDALLHNVSYSYADKNDSVSTESNTAVSSTESAVTSTVQSAPENTESHPQTPETGNGKIEFSFKNGDIVYVASDNGVIVKSSPTGSKIGSFGFRKKVQVIGDLTDGEWVKIQYGSVPGYISMHYLWHEPTVAERKDIPYITKDRIFELLAEECPDCDKDSMRVSELGDGRFFASILQNGTKGVEERRYILIGYSENDYVTLSRYAFKYCKTS